MTETSAADAERVVQMCSFCCWEQELPAPVSALQEHIARCPLHPIRGVERERDQMRTENERLRQREAALRRLYDASMKCWSDDADETPGRQKDPWVWADWIDAIEEAGAVFAQAEQS